MALDLSTDYAVLDGLEIVTLDGPAVANAYRLPDKVTEGDPSEGAYLHRNVEFQLPTAPAIAPVVGSVVVDAGGVSYNVLAVRQPFQGDYWGLTCREAAITAVVALRDLVTLYRATSTVSPAGSRKVTHLPVGAFTDVPAKIQLQPSVVKDVAAKRGFVDRYKVYVQNDLDVLNHGDLLRDQHANWYVITSWETRPRIDALSTIICTVRPGV